MNYESEVLCQIVSEHEAKIKFEAKKLKVFHIVL